MELKGNIRVFARIRPLISLESTSADLGPTHSSSGASLNSMGVIGGGGVGPDDAVAVRALDEERVAVAIMGVAGSERGGVGVKEFEFDRVFGPEDGQQQVCRGSFMWVGPSEYVFTKGVASCCTSKGCDVAGLRGHWHLCCGRTCGGEIHMGMCVHVCVCVYMHASL